LWAHESHHPHSPGLSVQRRARTRQRRRRQQYPLVATGADGRPAGTGTIPLRHEREDAKALGLAALLVPSTWLLLLGWSWERSVAGHDGLAQSLPLLQRLTQAGGDWSHLLYLPDWLGGSYVRDVVGPFPPFAAFTRLGFSPAETLNLTVFLWQVLLAFLGARLA